MNDDEDKKKDLDKDAYSALSDALDSEDTPSLEDLLKNHGIDLGSESDLEAMQDFSFADAAAPATEKPKRQGRKKAAKKPAEDELPSETSFDALFNDMAESPPPLGQAKHEVPTGAAFDALFEDDISTPVPTPPRRTQPKEEVPMGAEFDALFADISTPTKTSNQDQSIFETSHFDDVNADFPESKPGEYLGDEALFGGYEAQEQQQEPLFDDIGGGGMEPPEGMGSDMPPPRKGFDMKRLAARVGVMLALVLVIYGGLKFFLGKGEKHQEIAVAPSMNINAPMTPVTPIHAEQQPAVAVAPAAPVPEVVPTPELALTNPPSLPVPGTQAPTLVATPEAALSVPALTAPTISTTTVAGGPENVNQKLDQLEVTLSSINQRLSEASTHGVGDERLQRLERLMSDSTAPEMQVALEAAVKKMQELDNKMDRITELQQQVRALNAEVKTLKEDVVTQTNMVGEQQRLFNDNMQASQLKEPAPVKMVVQAAIPGRAWLRSERGELLTVIPGDEVPGYGRVVSIDAASGTVVTSSRAVFREQ